MYDRSGSDRNFTEPVGEAIDYWNERADRYTDYDLTFEYVPNQSVGYADLTVGMVDSVYRCGGLQETGDIAGCYKDEEEVQVRTDQNDLQVRNTAIHEIGHALILDHQDQPQWIMASGSDAGDGSITNARDRSNPWNTTGPLKIAIGDSIDNPDRVQLNIQSVANYYSDNDEYAPDGMDVVVVDEWYEAHVIVEDSSEIDYDFGGEPSSVAYSSGIDYDADEQFEQYSRGTIYLHDVDPSEADWHVGNWVGWYLGNSKDELPRRYSN